MSYREYPLDPAEVAPVDAAHAQEVPAGHCPVVDVRFITPVDKTALTAGFARRAPLRGRQKSAFQEWLGARFGRESFADPIAEVVLPAPRRRSPGSTRCSSTGGRQPRPAPRPSPP